MSKTTQNQTFILHTTGKQVINFSIQTLFPLQFLFLPCKAGFPQYKDDLLVPSQKLTNTWAWKYGNYYNFQNEHYVHLKKASFVSLAYQPASTTTAVNCFVVQFILTGMTHRLVMKVIHSRVQMIYIILLPLLSFLFIIQILSLPGVWIKTKQPIM